MKLIIFFSFLVVYKAVFFFILCRHPLHLLENHHVVQLVRQVHRLFCLKLLDGIEFFNKKTFKASEFILVVF